MESFPIITLRANPNEFNSIFSKVNPASALITWPPVKIAKSSSKALRRSPNPGALTATTFKIPRILFIIRVAKASFSTLSLIINNGWFVFDINSNVGSKSCFTRVIFFVC